GVVVLLVPPPKRLPLYGVTRWIDRRIPVIQQTGRRNRDGFVIWTLFHEIGHILNDPRDSLHVEYANAQKRTSEAERAANTFAMDTLFGPGGLTPFRNLTTNEEIWTAAS